MARKTYSRMGKEESRRMFNKICNSVADEIDKFQVGDSSVPTYKKLLDSILISEKNHDYLREETLKEKAMKGDAGARRNLILEIETIIIGMRLPMNMIDDMIMNYRINYYGSYKSIYKGNNPLFIKKLQKVFIRHDASKEVKLRKFSTMVFQEKYGLGVLDPFLYLGIDSSDMSKVEEVSSFCGQKVWLQISGLKELLAGLRIEDKEMRKLCDRLCKNALENLNKLNPEVETQSLRGDRITLRCAPYITGHSINIRLHYENAISAKERLRLGSTTPVVERFLDYIVKFSPNICVVGPQGTGKTTILRDIYRRYAPNTVIGTVESSREIALGLFDHLIVEEFQTLANKSYDEVLEDMLRAGLDSMVLGEVRNSAELEIMIQVMLRQSKGSACSFHSSTARDALYTMRTLLMKTHNYQSEREALFELCRAIDFMIVLGIDSRGKRIIKEICEIPDVKEKDCEDVTPFPIFEFNTKSYTTECVNGITKRLETKLLGKEYNPEVMEKLKLLCH